MQMIKFNKNIKKLLIAPIISAAVTLVSLTPATVFAAEVYYTMDRVNLRAEATTQSKVLEVANTGSEISVEEYVLDGWSKVVYNGKQGYMKSEYIGTKQQFDEADKSQTYPVELTPWSEAKQIFTIGVTANVVDVYTGLTYNVKSFSNGLHADVEPVTKEDTAVLKQTYGGKWDWDPRPVWVTINGKTMAASINGMPHGGGVNSDNGMNGQVCIHFKGSTTHNGNSSFARLHQEAAVKAFELSK